MSRSNIQWLKRAVLIRDDFQCVSCGHGRNDGLRRDLEVHHIVSIKEGGEDTIENLATVCTKCHKAWDALPSRHFPTEELPEVNEEDVFPHECPEKGCKEIFTSKLGASVHQSKSH